MHKIVDKILHNSLGSLLKAWDFKNDLVCITGLLSAWITIIMMNWGVLSDRYLGVSGAMLAMILVIIGTDFVTGILASYATKEKINSGKGIRSLYKIAVYMVFLFCTNTLITEYSDNLVSSLLRYAHVYITVHIFFWEAFSVDENLQKMGINLGVVKYLKEIFKTIQNKK